ncbi:hypothetical protein DPSP01_006274 [Paraphaeosphaeria sporulosa]
MAKSNLPKLQRLRDITWTSQQSILLQHYLQARNLPIGGTVEMNKLFKSAVLVTLCYDRMTVRPDKLLASGIATYVICCELLLDSISRDITRLENTVLCADA